MKGREKMNFVKPSKGTVIRTIVLLIALMNMLLATQGKAPLGIDETMVNGTVEAIYEAVSYVLMVVASLVAWWKNNSITLAAQAGDQLKNDIKTEQKEVTDPDLEV